MICDPGPSRWHCFRSKPQREQSLARWLKDFADAEECFFPIKTEPRVVRGQKTEAQIKLLPSYVFVMFPGAVRWHLLRDLCPYLISCIRTVAGEIAILDPRDLERLYQMRAIAEEEQTRRDRARFLRRGDRVRLPGVIADAAEGPVEILDLAGEMARVEVRMFGVSRQIKVAQRSLVKE